MHRGMPIITVYTFEAAPGRDLAYPDAELWTLDESEARAYAREKGCQLIGTDWTDGGDSELIEDFTPKSTCKFCGADITKNGSSDAWINPEANIMDVSYCETSTEGGHQPES